MNLRTRMASALLAAAAVFTLAACGSSVKLDEPPVSDAKAVPVSPPVTVASTSPSGTQTGVSQRAVEPVAVGTLGADAAGPAGVAKVILFDYDSFVIKPEYQSAIDAHARFLSANKTRKLNIEGHTDERGGREYNLALGQKRAEAVRRALGLLGVTDAQLEAVSFGEEKPADAALTEEAFAKNRRAELAYR
ncbi:MAG: peptidoglycan-associated lipoprotein Pal [Brachymonas sp.]